MLRNDNTLSIRKCFNSTSTDKNKFCTHFWFKISFENMQLREKVNGPLENRLTRRKCPGKFNESVCPTQLRCTLKYEAHAIMNTNRMLI